MTKNLFTKSRLVTLIIVLGIAWSKYSFGFDACSPGLFSFVCKNEKQNIQLNRCANNRGCYDHEYKGQQLRCCPTGKTTDEAKLAFVDLSQSPNEKTLTSFKSKCDFNSPIDFNNDTEISDTMKVIFKSGNTYAIRALIFAESHCVDITNHEAILSWLGNEFLIDHTLQLIEAFYAEGKNDHLPEIALLENNKWRGLECKDDLCKLNRNTYFESKLDALQHVKVSKKLEPTRQTLLDTLSSVSDAATRSFINLGKNPTHRQLLDFKTKCTISSPVDFKKDPEVQQAVQKAIQSGDVHIIQAMIYAEANCTDVTGRKNILRWLGNEILMDHAANFIEAADNEDRKHELYDIAEVENIEWSKKQCLDDPCKLSRKSYFAGKRKALEQAKIEGRLEPYRKMLLQGLKSDQ